MPAAIDRPEVKVESQTVQPEEQKSAEPQKEPVPFICELCYVKCESAPVFDSHLKGKKHIYNFQRFQEQQAQAALGQVALQALYPALEAALYPALLQALAYNGPNPVATQEAVANQVEPVNETESKTEDEVKSKSKTEDQVEPESKTEDQVEPESKTEYQAEPEIKTGQVDPNAVECFLLVGK
ncbi:hypothetical protein L1987_41917 [Smallanthus sonchifolius]|uniref:Uncharacterized protein n=1 Tax=Smallanthus sonchifolius TaxID=185202 RepID=A0ACB9GWV6_9ASTR|nr:hypothetical protein L1987_41917 [Smallanthus sonchifolius]